MRQIVITTERNSFADTWAFLTKNWSKYGQLSFLNWLVLSTYHSTDLLLRHVWNEILNENKKTLLWSNSTQALVAVSRASLVEVIWLCTRPLSVWITTSGSWRRERWDLLLVNTVTGNDLKDNWYILSIIIYYCFMSCQADVERQRDERRADELFRYFKDRSQPVLLWLIFRGPLAFVDS